MYMYMKEGDVFVLACPDFSETFLCTAPGCHVGWRLLTCKRISAICQAQ